MRMVKNKSRYVIHKYPKEHYLTIFDRQDGFFARIEENGYSEPLWSSKGPELIDISITNWCDKGCSICYKNSNTHAHHMSLSKYEAIMVQAQKMNVLQVALGGGNPNQHPDFSEILRITREKYGIVPSYTTNGRGLDRDILEASAKFCGAVAVSAYEPYEEIHNAIRLLSHYGIKTNVHFILTSKSVLCAVEWLKCPPSFLEKINAIIFLNYKPVGKYKDYKLLLRNNKDTKCFFNLAVSHKRKFNVGFDSCLVSGLAKFTKTDSIFYDFCDSGRFSMYISEELKMYPCSFMTDGYEGIRINDDNILDTWQNSKLFNTMRNRKHDPTCSACLEFKICNGGCPIFSEVNICRA